MLLRKFEGHDGLSKMMAAAKRNQAEKNITTLHLFTGTVYLTKTATFAHMITPIPVELYVKGAASPDMDLPSVYDDQLLKTPQGWKLLCRKAKIRGCPVYMQHLCGDSTSLDAPLPSKDIHRGRDEL